MGHEVPIRSLMEQRGTGGPGGSRLMHEEVRLGSRTALPEHGSTPDEVRRLLEEIAQDDVTDWESRLMAGGTYPAGDEVLAVAKDAYLRFFSTNPLYASSLFHSLTAMEREVVAMTADLLHAPDGRGSITSGGSESILMGVKIARDRARELHPGITAPEMVVPLSAHPAFWKAAHYFGLTVRRAPLREDFQLDVDAYRALIGPDTVLLVGSAPSLTLGMVDPVEELAPIAAERGISFHVDSCVGGYFLPFAEQLGRPIPRFDFRVPGVTTISADLHKFGYAAKGASCIISRDPDIFRFQPFAFGAPERPADWYVTPSMTGTRPGGAIAAAWAVLNHLGRDGYLRLTATALAYMDRFRAGIDAIPGLRVLGDPAMTVFGYTSDTLDIFAIAAGLTERGWMVFPDEWPVKAIRFMQSPGHEPYIDRYLADLREVAEEVRSGRLTAEGGRARYT
ncbi:MAG: aminotransferase class V-fold PLP-dependent enzyme [Chloroflexota bacterium]